MKTPEPLLPSHRRADQLRIGEAVAFIANGGVARRAGWREPFLINFNGTEARAYDARTGDWRDWRITWKDLVADDWELWLPIAMKKP